jgi:Tol biopolymer transport system component/DNA-binding winged helix-turn-helix (wHTH) protein
LATGLKIPEKSLPPSVRFYEFGPFLVDAQKCLLLRQGEVIALTPKAFETLLVLVRHRGGVLEKEVLLKELWPHTIVDENNLARNVSTLRKALGQAAGEHEYVVTVPGRGYRFVASVREMEEGSAGVDAVAAPRIEPPEAAAPGRTGRRTALLAALAVAALVPLLVWTTRSSRLGPHPQRRLWQLTFEPGLESEPTWSKDGHLIAYSSDQAGNFDIWVQPVGEGKAVQVTASKAHDWQPDWAPDGSRLVFRSEREGGGLFVVPGLGGEERRISTFGYRPRWSPDGSQVLFYSSIHRNVTELPKVYVLSPGSAPQEVIASFLADFVAPRVAWHPDGHRLSVWGRHRESGWSFWNVPLSGGKAVRSEVDGRVAQQLKETAVTFRDFRWSPSGRALYFEGLAQEVKNLWRVEVEPRTLRWVGGPERLTTGAGIETEMGLSPDGTKLAFTIRNEQIRLWSLPFDAAEGRLTGGGRPITAPGMDALLPDLSPDGRRLAFLAHRARKQEVWGKSLDDGRETPLAATAGFRRAAPRWSPDGSWLAYRRTRVANAEATQFEHALVLLPAAGGDEQALTSPSPRWENALDWSADGQWILGNSERPTPGRFSLSLFPTAAAPRAETKMRVIASDPESNLWQARYSPDQRWISFVAIKALDAAIATIHAVPASGGEWTRLTEGRYWDDKPRWAPDGRTLYFLSNRAGFFNVWGIRIDSARGRPIGEPFRVTAFESPGPIIMPEITTMEIALSADRLVLPIMEASGGIWILENVEPR